MGEAVPSDGFTRTNTAHVSLTFPSNPELGTLNAGNRSASVLVTPRPAQFAPTLTASVAGGGNPVPGTVVTFTGGGTMSQQDAGVGEALAQMGEQVGQMAPGRDIRRVGPEQVGQFGARHRP